MWVLHEFLRSANHTMAILAGQITRLQREVDARLVGARGRIGYPHHELRPVVTVDGFNLDWRHEDSFTVAGEQPDAHRRVDVVSVPDDHLDEVAPSQPLTLVIPEALARRFLAVHRASMGDGGPVGTVRS
jgi:hypothetical protein